MELQLQEARLPITAALDYAAARGSLTPERLRRLREELTALAAESAKKFVGFKDVDDVRRALEIALGTVSLALAHRTNGDRNPAAWALYLLAAGPKAAAREAIGLVRALEADRVPALFNPEEQVGPPARDMLLKFAAGVPEPSSRAPAHVWHGYSFYRNAVATRQMARLEALLSRHLVGEIVGVDPDQWSRAIVQKFAEGSPVIDQAVNTVLLRHVLGMPVPRLDASLDIAEFRAIRAAYEAKPKSWLKRARARYEALVEKVPDELRPALAPMGVDWFDVHLAADGPPQVPGGTRTEAVESRLSPYWHKE